MIHLEAWYREAQGERRLQQVLRDVERGDGQAVAEALQLLLRAGRPRKALQLLKDHMNRPDVPLRAKYDFMDLIRNFPTSALEEDATGMDWLLHNLRDEFDEAWFGFSVMDELNSGRLDPKDPLVKLMWESVKPVLPHVPWSLVEKMPDEYVPYLVVEEITETPESLELEELRGWFGRPDLEPNEEYFQRFRRRQELQEARPGQKPRKYHLKELVRLLREEYETPDQFTSVYVKKGDPTSKLFVGGYVGISGPIYWWVMGG